MDGSTGGWHWSPGFAPGRPDAAAAYRQAGFATRFPTQAEAEAWLGEAWPELADLGVVEVTLVEGDRVVYGPMSLSG
ncbi:hypothetical protein GC722_15300 [Auraticoccus sp. F435]|uniref:Uncharacterized protein n=1 Tax=Auraticoccus cholistanensis TaxID=2656650 RepID=A0A6A9UZN0_9ACTN|nr:hypothetical protein [Auraticoccus cholistanensis]MVA77377.1 hypothetical protein [Auraticoccus cholistanensis]